MKKLYISACLLITLNGFSQSSVEWSKCLGGIDEDYGFEIIPAGDGYILASNTASVDGDIAGSHGGLDVWVARLDADGNILWSKTYGGTADDYARGIVEATDGGWVVSGSSFSNDGDVESNNGDRDAWIFKIDDIGTLQWSKSYGGDSTDLVNRIIKTTDNDYLVIGNSTSYNEDLVANYGKNDIWVLKLNSSGDIDWSQHYGGSQGDFGFAAKEAADGYVFAGFSDSNDGDVSGHHGAEDEADYWVFKTNFDGAIQWQKSLGGDGEDYSHDLTIAADNSILITGASFSDNGDITDHNGAADESDTWIVKLGTTGNIIWKKSIGGTQSDQGNFITADPDGGFITINDSESNDGDVSGHHGGTSSTDAWVAKINEDGSPIWQRSFGGSQDDESKSIRALGGGYYIASGFTRSTNGDITFHHGLSVNNDIWILALSPCSPIIITEPTPKTLCEGDSLILFVHTNEGSYNYQWLLNGVIDVGTNADTLVIPNVTEANEGHYTCVVSGDCSDTTSADVLVTINALPIVSVTLLGSLNICASGEVGFNAYGTFGYTYIWYKDGTPIDGAVDHEYTTTEPGTYYVDVFNAAGCSGTSDTFVVIDESPSADITASATNFCSAFAITLSVPYYEGYNYYWSYDDHPLPAVDTSVYTAHFAAAFQCIVVAAGCVDTSNYVVLLDTVPTATVSAPTYLKICTTGAINLSTADVAYLGYGYEWLQNGLPIAGASDSVYTATTAGNYQLVLLNADGCSDTSTIITVIDTCSNTIVDPEFYNAVSVFPNPNTGSFDLELLHLPNNAVIEIDIVNMFGQKIYTDYSPDPKKHITIENEAPGIYIINILYEGNRMFSKSFVISR